jgi:hypothetical protein
MRTFTTWQTHPQVKLQFETSPGRTSSIASWPILIPENSLAIACWLPRGQTVWLASFRHYMERHNPGSIGFCGGVDTGVKFFFRRPPRSWRPLRGLIIIIGSSKVCLVFG